MTRESRRSRYAWGMTDDAPAAATSALQAIRGPVAAVHSPFDETGRLAPDVIPAYAAHLRDSGVGAAYVGGSTGESLALSVAERRAILEAWMSVAGEDLHVIAHVGSNALPDSLELARHADALGVDGISAMNPTFGRAADVEALQPMVIHEVRGQRDGALLALVAHVVVEATQEERPAIELGHIDPEAVEDARELDRDVATSDDKSHARVPLQREQLI